RQILVHVAQKRQERRYTDTARDPDLLHPAPLVIEHSVGTLDDRMGALRQFRKELAGEITTGFDGEAQHLLRRGAGDGKGMRFVQALILWKAHEQELAGALFWDRGLLGAQRDLRRGAVRVPYSSHPVGQRFPEEA